VFKDTLKQIMEDLEDLISDLEAADGADETDHSEVIVPLDEAYRNLEDAKRVI
jgi:hypothetical protein